MQKLEKFGGRIQISIPHPLQIENPKIPKCRGIGRLYTKNVRNKLWFLQNVKQLNGFNQKHI
jgi:hypothetical protein